MSNNAHVKRVLLKAFSSRWWLLGQRFSRLVKVIAIIMPEAGHLSTSSAHAPAET